MKTLRQFFENYEVKELRLLRDLLDDVIAAKELHKSIMDLNKDK